MMSWRMLSDVIATWPIRQSHSRHTFIDLITKFAITIWLEKMQRGARRVCIMSVACSFSSQIFFYLTDFLYLSKQKHAKTFNSKSAPAQTIEND